MTTYLLDTSVIIDVLNGKHNQDALLKGLLSQGDLLACCAVNVSEVYAGMRPKEETKTEALLQSLITKRSTGKWQSVRACSNVTIARKA